MARNTEPDAFTAIKLGQALFHFLARRGDEADLDDFGLEDAGVDIRSGFIDLDTDTMDTVRELLDTDEEGRV